MKNIKELSIREMNSVNGGESFWYRVGQGVGYLVGKLEQTYDSIISQSSDRPTSWLYK